MVKQESEEAVVKKDKVGNALKDSFLVILGCALVAFSDVAFIIPCNIVNGGVDSVAVIINYFAIKNGWINLSDVVVAVLQVALWLLGLWLLGKKFSLYTLLGSIAFPLLFSLMLRTHLDQIIHIDTLFGPDNRNIDGSLNLAVLMLGGIFGGAIAGIGVALTFMGNGSMGGFDVISFIIAKYTDMKQDLSGFFLDSGMIVVGFFCLQSWQLALVGILSAFCNALGVQFIFVYANSYIIVDIISSKNKEIQSFIQNEMGHGTTLVKTKGGFSGEERDMVRVVIYQVEMSELRSYIATVDPKAFVSFVTAKTIHGNGFDPLTLSATTKRRLLERYGIKKPTIPTVTPTSGPTIVSGSPTTETPKNDK